MKVWTLLSFRPTQFFHLLSCFFLLSSTISHADEGEILDQSFDAVAAGGAVTAFTLENIQQNLGQTFTVGISGELSRVGVQIFKARQGFPPTEDIRLSILRFGDGIPETAIEVASAVIPSEQVPLMMIPVPTGFIDIDLSESAVLVSAGSVLAIALHYAGSGTYLWRYRLSGDLYTGGGSIVRRADEDWRFTGGGFRFRFSHIRDAEPDQC